MGLFRRKAAAEPVTPEPSTVKVNHYTNITEKNVKIDIPEDDNGKYIKGVYLWEEDGKIRGLDGDKVIFEVTNRSKAYKELSPYARQKTESIVLKRKEGDYGTYYRLQFSFIEER